MLKATLDDGLLFKNIISSFKDIVNEGCLEFDKDGMSMQSMDASHIVLCFFKIDKSNFSRYECPKSFVIACSFVQLLLILSCSEVDDSISFLYEDTADTLEILLGSYEFNFKLMDINSDKLYVPETVPYCKIKMPSKTFKKIITNIDKFGNNVTISCTKNNITFETDDSGTKTTLSINPSEEDDSGENPISSYTFKKNVKHSYSIKRMVDFTKPCSFFDEVVICMIQDQPILVEFNIEDSSVIRYYLAPKMPEE